MRCRALIHRLKRLAGRAPMCLITSAAAPVFLGAPPTLIAQESPPAADTRPPDGMVAPASGDITGRRLDGFRLPMETVDGAIELEAARAWIWSEPEEADEAALEDLTQPGRATRRLLLSGNVRVRLGTHALAARRALVWLAPLPEADPEAAPDVWQVFVYLDGARAQPGSTFAVSGPRVPIRAVLRTPRGVRLRADLSEQGRPVDPFVEEGEQALRQRLHQLTASPIETPRAAPRLAEIARELPPGEWPQPIFAEGIVTITPGDALHLVHDEDETALIATGGVHLQYWDRARNATLQLSAQRAVVFLEPGRPADLARFSIDRVRGFYLEGDVTATDGQYTARAPRVYYDVRENRAVLVDAVFWTYDRRLRMPLYLRASSLRQLSADQFRATSAMLTNTAFFDPDLSIGASSVTLTRMEEPEGTRNHIDARDITLRAGGFPFFYWPVFRGDPEAMPLRGIGFMRSRGAGVAIQSSWDAYTLIGIEPPAGHDATLLLDYYIDRGPALGMSYRWSGVDSRGGLFAYGLPSDGGEDLLVSGARRDPPQRTRGIVMLDHRAELDEYWTFTAEGAFITDPAFVQVFFDHARWARDRREFTNALRLQRVERNTFLGFEASARLQDFLVNDYLIQTPGYSVDKLPEVQYYRAADDVLERWPGLLTWTHEYRAGIVRMNFHEPTARELGFTTAARAERFWGIAPDESPADVLRAQGLHEDPVLRFDTRHELNMPLRAGPVQVTPFVVGRATLYDQDFDEFSPEMDDPYRFWGAAGLTLSTELTRIDNRISSRFFDLHRIRHIVRPNATFWHAESTIDREHMPVYDAVVEDLVDGSAMRFGIDQVWQTQRGGPGRWRSVDVFRLNTEVVVSSGDVVRKSPIPRFFEFRPEYSNLGGTFATAEAAWQMTEIIGIGAEAVYDFEIDSIARFTVGATIQHTPDFSMFAEIRYLNAQDQTYANVGARYELTRKYIVSMGTSYDTDRNEFTVVSSQIQRIFPNVILGIALSHNRINNDTSIGLILQPVGMGLGATRIGGPGASMPDARRAGFGG